MRKKKEVNISAAYTQAFNLTTMQKLFEKCFSKAVAAQAKYYNSKHKPRKYNVKNLIYLNN